MNRERRAVLRGVAALTGVTVGFGTTASASNPPIIRQEEDAAENQQVDTELPPGVTLFDLDGDGEYTATVERASSAVQDDAHPNPIHVTSGGRSTLDYATSIAEPPDGTTIGGLSELSYDYYEGMGNGDSGAAGDGDSGGTGTATQSGEGGTDQNGADGASQSGEGDLGVPGETFLVVETDDGRHGMYLTYDDGAPGEWRTFDVLARVQGDVEGTSGWFEYTDIESGYDGQTFANVVERFGADARLVRVGVGCGNAVTPTTLDVFYDNLVIDGETQRFPTEVAKRVANANPL